MITRRAGGVALLVYGVATIVAGLAIATPGGDYESGVVDQFVSSSHYPVAFVAAYVGSLGAVAILPFVLGVRAELGRLGELAWGLGVAAVASGVIGWFVSGGVAVAMAEGGSRVTSGVPAPVVYTLTEIGNLVGWCAPAFFMGMIAILLSRVSSLPRGLRIFSVVAGVCGILAPFYFTFFVYLLWTLVLGATLALRGRSSVPQAEGSFV